MLTVKIPNGKIKEEYSLYVSGYVIDKYTEESIGTMLYIKGTGVAFYSAKNSRRAIVFQELSEEDYNIPLEEAVLPYIKQKVRIIYKAKGRKIDLLKMMIYNLEKKYNKDIYQLGTLYWLEISSYIDSVRRHSKGSNSTKRQTYLITEKYKQQMERLNENIC